MMPHGAWPRCSKIVDFAPESARFLSRFSRHVIQSAEEISLGEALVEVAALGFNPAHERWL